MTDRGIESGTFHAPSRCANNLTILTLAIQEENCFEQIIFDIFKRAAFLYQKFLIFKLSNWSNILCGMDFRVST